MDGDNDWETSQKEVWEIQFNGAVSRFMQSILEDDRKYGPQDLADVLRLWDERPKK